MHDLKSRAVPLHTCLVQATGPHEGLEPGEQPWPAEGFATCRPISTVTELLSWQPPKHLQALAPDPDAAPSQPSQRDPCACSTELVLPETMGYTSAAAPAGKAALAPNGQSACSAGSPRQQLLVCHDMMGGYLDYESTPQGTADASEYRIWHWDCMDIFVYFSHHLVTIPPAGWIHAAHKHGVKVRVPSHSVNATAMAVVNLAKNWRFVWEPATCLKP